MASPKPVTSRIPNYILIGCRQRPFANHRNKSSINNSSSNTDHPVDDYYSLLLSQPFPSATSLTIAPTCSSPSPTAKKEATLEKARVIFGSRLAGPAARRNDKHSKSTAIAGVLVPPRPLEPDNCCMSGCVNCVWDAYRDDLEEWATKNQEARKRQLKTKGQETRMSSNTDNDGGETAGNWTAGEDGKELFEGIPVGIREFMRTEKLLKERHLRERSTGG